jgi:hypothetical protein
LNDLIIPDYAGGFELDWTKVIPINFDDLAMYIHPRIAITFEKIWSLEKQEQMSIGHLLTTCEDFNCDDFEKRFNEFKPFKNARVSRVFEGRRHSVFFDEEEIETLAAIFKTNKFTAIINIYVDGQPVDIRQMPPRLFRVIAPLLDNYHVIYPLPATEYRSFRKVEIHKIRKEKTDMDKKILFLKLIGGMLLLGLGMTTAISGTKMAVESLDEILGKVQNIAEIAEDAE